MTKSEVENVLQSVGPPIEEFATSNLTSNGPDEGMFLAILKASLLKSYEFTLLCAQTSRGDHSFFLVPALRGICEDLIDIAFIGCLAPSDRDSVIEALLKLQCHSLCEKQYAFFQTFRPFQPVFDIRDQSEADGAHAVLSSIAKRTGHWTYSKSKPMQSAKFRADKAGLLSFYNFYYAFTSEAVHFSPHGLVRLGWGKTTGGKRNPSRVSFSTKNFEAYYNDVIRLYGLVLFSEMISEFSKVAVLPPAVVEASQLIGVHTSEVLRWPEPITYEEYNIRGPGTLSRLFAKIKHDNLAK